MRKLFWERLNNWFGPYFNQRDAEWYDDPLGNVGRKGTMGSSGCLVACVAMVWSHLTHEYRTPKDVNKHKDLFGAGSMAMNDPLPTLGGHKPREYHDISFDTLHALSKQGNALILELVWINNSGENVYHYVVGTNLDTDGTLLINDPWFGGAIGVRYGQYWSNNNFTGRAWAYK